MRISFRTFIFFALTAGFSGCSTPPDPGGADGSVLAVVGDRKFTATDLERKLEDIPSYARTNFETVDGKKKLLDRLVRTELLRRAAEDAGYESRPEIKDKIDEARERILTSEYFKNEMGQPPGPPEQELMKYYEDHKDRFKTEKTAEIRHILFEDEDTALSVRRRIENGSITFEKAVSEYSSDVQTKNDGGALGTIREGGFIRGVGRSAELEEVVFGLKPGDLTEPVKTRKGWHIVRVDSIDSGGYRPFEEVREQISDELMVTDAEIEKEYRDHSQDYMTRARCKIKHIQLATEKEARDVYSKLQSGADYNEMVEKFSTDTASVKQNGSLGYLYRDGYVRGIGKDLNFEEVVFGMKEGEISKPVETKKGWHIVLVEEKTDESLKPLADVRTQIKNKLIRDKKETGVETKFDRLKEKYDCRIYEDRIESSDPAQ